VAVLEKVRIIIRCLLSNSGSHKISAKDWAIKQISYYTVTDLHTIQCMCARQMQIRATY